MALVVGVLHHLSIEDCRRALAEIVHVVKPNAKALIMEDTDGTGLVRTTHNLDQGAFNTFESRMDVDDGRVLHYRIFLDIRQRSLLLFRLRASQKITMDEIELQDKSSGHGDLFIAEVGKQVPFDIKRFYFMGNVPVGGTRGAHAHKRTEQAVFCLRGSCTLLTDDGAATATTKLDSPKKGALLRSRVWHSLSDFSPDAVVLVVANEPYDEADYIHDHEAFLEYIK